MKKILLLLLMLVSGINILAQTTAIPDPNFEQALIDLGYDTTLNGSVLTANINTITFLNVSSKNISDLTGIEDFTALINLNCNTNQISSLDVSQNLDLLVLTCNNNLLSCLDLSQNTALTSLSCNTNELISLDVSQNVSLQSFSCGSNFIKSLNLVNNIALTDLICSNNQLSYLNVKNGNNTIFTQFSSVLNINLACIEVDNAVYSNTNWTNIDATSSFSEDCGQQALVYVPDDNFEQALIDLGYDCFLDDFVPAANVNTITQLFLDNKSIFDFTGINSFTALENLSISANPISQSITFNINNLTALEGLSCLNSQLTSLDVSQNIALTNLACNNNQLTNLDLSQNTALTSLDCHLNQLTSLDVSQNTALASLNCRSNQLSSLDVSQNTGLTFLHCQLNDLTSLDVNQNIALTDLNSGVNQLTSLSLNLNTSLTSLDCSFNGLTSLKVKNGNNTNFTFFRATNNPSLTCIEVDDATYSTINWTSIDAQTSFSEDCSGAQTFVPDNNFEQALIDLGYDSGALDDFVPTANINTITSLTVFNKSILDLTGIEDFVALTNLNCGSNQLTSLDITQNVALTTFSVSNNQLTNIDLSQNTALTSLDCSSNLLTSLNVKNGNNTNFEDFDSRINPNLICIEVDDAAYSTTNWLIIDPASSFSEDCSVAQTYVPDDNFEQALIDLGYDSGTLDDFVPTANINTITSLNVNGKNITDLTGIEDFVSLTSLTCSSNQLSALDVSQNILLTSLDCSTNQLTNLNLDQNTQLVNLICNLNQLTAIDLTQNIALKFVRVVANQLTALDVSQNIFLEVLYFSDNQLTTIDISQNSVLTELYCRNNMLASLDLSQNTQLVNLGGSDNQLTSLDVSQNTALSFLNCRSNQLTNLDVNQNIGLTVLDCRSNQLTDLDLSQNTALTVLDCRINLLTSLNIKNGNNTNIIQFESTSNPNLICIEVDDATYSAANWTVIDPASSFSEDCTVVGLTYVPGDNFEQALIDLGYDSGALDDYVPTANINAITSLDVGFKNIFDLTGIEDFNALTTLNCSGNQLTSLDVSQNIALTSLDCHTNQLTNLDVTQNTALIDLACYDNLLTVLDITQNTLLSTLTCSSNQITNLDVSLNTALLILNTGNNLIANLDLSSNIALQRLECSNNQLTSLDVSLNTNLTELYFPTNQLTNIDITQNTALEHLDFNHNQFVNLNVSQNTALIALRCYNNLLINLDVSQNTSLTSLICYENLLTNLDVSSNVALISFRCNDNQLASLNVKNGNNTNFNAFNSLNNPNLTCIEVDDVTYSTTNWTDIDPASSFSEDCTVVGLTYVPGDNFEQALIDLGYDSGALDDYVPTANISTITSLNVNAKSISDLTGIKDFVALSDLICSNNNLTDLNLTQNTALTTLNLSSNQLTSLDVTQNTALLILGCSSNQLTNLDLSQNTALETLLCDSNQLTNLDVSTNVALKLLKSYQNNLTSLDLSQNTALEVLTCYSNQLTNLDVSQNTTLKSLSCHTNQLTDLDVSQNTALILLACGANQLTSLNVSQNVVLEQFSCDFNQLTSLDVSQNTVLTRFLCNNNQLSDLNIKNGNNTAILGTLFDATNNPNLSCIEVDNVAYSNSNWTQIDTTSSFSEDCTAPPIITLNGANPQTIQLGDGYTELGATTNDGSAVTIDASEFVDVVGSYTIYYNATDSNGNAAIEVTRIVNVVDSNAPIITLNGANPQTIQLGDGYTELGATTNDGSAVTIDASEFVDVVGSYTIYYNATDNNGNAAIEVTRIVNVVDSNAPIITLNGANPQTIQLGDGYTELGATTNDGSAVTIDASEFVDVVGSYTIYYNATDSNGNAAIEVTRIVNVVDSNAPIITLNGANPQTIQLGDGYTELGATTNDGSAVTINASEFVDAVGSYTIYYNATDSNGNTAIEVIRTVNVIDSNAPIITLNGANPQTIELGDGYTELGATTDDGSTVDIDATAFVDAVGTYTIYYNATDSNGNAAIEVTRTVNVIDSNAPIITLNGANPQTIQLGDGYTELGATTNDGSAVTIDASEFVDAVGSYTIYYNATDSNGNVATEITRTVNVVDSNGPVITLNGANPQTIELGDGYTELGATTDDGSTVDIDATAFVDAIGSYTIYYNATDSNGNAATEVTRTVNVVDSNAPIITLNGTNPQTIQLGDGYTELGAITDDGSAVVIDASEFVDAVGTYTIYYNATDSNGNDATEVTRTVNVIHTEMPILVAKGFSPNGDNASDTWRIENIQDYPNHKITVYNRWGSKVFETRNYQNNWNGISRNNGTKKLPIGPYLYVIELNDSETAPIRGWVYINY